MFCRWVQILNFKTDISTLKPRSPTSEVFMLMLGNKEHFESDSTKSVYVLFGDQIAKRPGFY